MGDETRYICFHSVPAAAENISPQRCKYSFPCIHLVASFNIARDDFPICEEPAQSNWVPSVKGPVMLMVVMVVMMMVVVMVVMKINVMVVMMMMVILQF